MNIFLLKLLELSLQAGVLTMGILLVRLVFKKLPAKYLCILWAIVALRLLIPFSIETDFAWTPNFLQRLWLEEQYKTGDIYAVLIEQSLIDYEGNVIESYRADSSDHIDYYLNAPDMEKTPVESVGTTTDIYAELIEHTVIRVEDGTRLEGSVSPTPVPEGISGVTFGLDWRELLSSVTPVLFGLWVLGTVILLGYGMFSYLRVKCQVKNAIPYEDNIWLCDGLQTPFVFGWSNPQIYLPTNLEEEQLRFVILHEKGHVARGDQYTKLLGFILLSVYWFNPLIWIAYVTFCKDVERACDERVIDGLDGDGRKGYAEALLECSVDRRFSVSNPLAFGEMDVKKRIAGILQYKKPGGVALVIAMLLCMTAVAGCFFVKEKRPTGLMGPSPTPMPMATATPIPTAEPPRGDGPYTPTPIPTFPDYVWMPTVTHIPSDLVRENSDEDLLGIYTEETLCTVPLEQTVIVDMNGDGTEEEISYDAWNLTINGKAVLTGDDTVFGDEFRFRKVFYIFDADITDGYKEIGLRGTGPDGSVGIHLYRYDGGQLQSIGGFRVIQDYNREELDCSVPGDGTIWTKEREFLLETCNVVKKHRLEAGDSGLDARIEPERRGYYEFLGWQNERDCAVTAAYEFKAFVSDCLDDETVVLVPDGSEITFVDYYLSHEEWGRGYVRFLYSVEEKWDSEGWLILSSDGIIVPRGSDEEPFGNVEPNILFHNLSHAG